MENRAYAFIAGLFAILLCSSLVAGFWWLGGSHIAESEYEIASRFPVQGLNQQAAVRYRGVDVGRVSDIQIDPSDPRVILVRISVDSRLHLTRGCFADLASQGLTGLSYIELDDSGQDKAALGNNRIPMRESELTRLMASGKNLISKTELLEEDATRLLRTLNQLLDEQNTQKISRLITHMERSSAALEPLLHSSQKVTDKAGRLLAEIRPSELSETMASLRDSSESLRQTSDAARPTLDKMQHSLEEFERIGRHIEQVSTELGETLNGTTLPQAHDLARQLYRDAENLNRLIDTLEQHPESVIFGKPQPVPGPGEKGFQP